MRYRKFDDVDAEDINFDGDSGDSSGYAHGAGRPAGDSMGDEVVPGVFVSDLQTVRAHREEIDSEIDTVISVCQDVVEFEQADLIHLPIAESDAQAAQHGGEKSFAQFARAANEIQDSVQAGEEVLVHCHAGINRSVGTTAAALGRIENGMETFEALERIQTERPRANPLTLTRSWMQAWDHGLGLDESGAVSAIVGELSGRGGRTRSRRSGGYQKVARSDWGTRTRSQTRAEAQRMNEMFGAAKSERTSDVADSRTDDSVQESDGGLFSRVRGVFGREESAN